MNQPLSFFFGILFVQDCSVIFKEAIIWDTQILTTALVLCLFDSPFESMNRNSEMMQTISMSEFLHGTCECSKSQLHHHSLTALCYTCLRSRNYTVFLTGDLATVSFSIRKCCFPSHYKHAQASIPFASSSSLAQTLSPNEHPSNCLMLS